MDERIKELRYNSEKAEEYFLELLAYTLGPMDLKRLMEEDKVNIVDVRRKEDYKIAHIPGAISITIEEITDHLEKLSKEKISIVYSYNQQCHLGIRACLILADYGYPCMKLDGGFQVWKEDFRFAVQASDGE